MSPALLDDDDEAVRAAVRALADRAPLVDRARPEPQVVRFDLVADPSVPQSHRLAAVAAVLFIVVGLVGAVAVASRNPGPVVDGSPGSDVADPAPTAPDAVDGRRALLTGQLLDDTGRPVVGAAVEVSILEQFGADERAQVGDVIRFRTIGTARSGGDGRFLVLLDLIFVEVDDARLVESPDSDPPFTNFRVHAFAPGLFGAWAWSGTLTDGPTGRRWIDLTDRDAGPSAPAASVTITMRSQNLPSTTVPAPTAPPATQTLTTRNPPREG